MNISEIFIRRPIMTTLLMAAVLIFGTIAYRTLPVSDLPNVDFPTIQVSVNLPGASPETMASAVATPLEQQFSTIAGIDSMTSTNSLGVTRITLQFDLNRDIDAASQDVQTAISESIRHLPPTLPTPPSMRKVNPADSPILYLTLSSKDLPLSEVDEYAETLLAQRISMISGVAQVHVYGAQKYAVRVRLDPNALAARSIGIDEVAAAVDANNVNLPTGTLWGHHEAVTVQAAGQLMKAEDYRPLIVAYRGGAPVRLGELGQVMDSVENDKIASWSNEERAIMLSILRQPGTNTVEVVRRIKEVLPSIQSVLPASVNLAIRYDRSESIQKSVRDVQITLVIALILVVLVIFLFLRNMSATVIPSLALPLSIIGTFAIMYFMHFSLDNLSLMALTLCVGFVVDDAIVMLENIMRHIERGEKPFEAALNGSREISFTILSMTISLVAVFIPVLFMGGIVGRLLNEFAMVIVVAVLISGAVSLSLTPMLCSIFLRPSTVKKQSRIYEASEIFFDWILRIYEKSLGWTLKHRPATLVVLIASIAAVVALFLIVPKGFLPSEDTDQLSGFTEARQGISYDSMVAHQKQAAAIVMQDPNVQTVMSSVGPSGSIPTMNSGRLNIRLKPRSERDLSADEVIPCCLINKCYREKGIVDKRCLIKDVTEAG